MCGAARRAQTGQKCPPVPRGGGRAGQGARGGGCGTRRDGAAPEPLATRSHQSPEGEPGAPRGRGRGGPGAGGGRRWGAAGAQVPGVGGGETGRGSVGVRAPRRLRRTGWVAGARSCPQTAAQHLGERGAAAGSPRGRGAPRERRGLRGLRRGPGREQRAVSE